MMHLKLTLTTIVAIIPMITAANSNNKALSSSTQAHVLRLKPGEDPKTVLEKYVKTHEIKASSIVSAVGSLKRTVLRYANEKSSTTLEGFREVVSLSGTLGSTSGSHLHLSVSDSKGVTLGGHLQEGSQVYTTLEVVLLSFPQLEFAREHDPVSTFNELVIRSKK